MRKVRQEDRELACGPVSGSTEGDGDVASILFQVDISPQGGEGLRDYCVLGTFSKHR